MGWMPPPDGIEVCHAGDIALPATEEKASMEKATIIGIDLAKRVFQMHGATQDGRPVFRKKVSRAQFLGFLAKQSPAVVAFVKRSDFDIKARNMIEISLSQLPHQWMH